MKEFGKVQITNEGASLSEESSDSWDEGPRPPTILKLPQKNRNKTLEKSLTSNRVKERHHWGSPKPAPHFSDETAEAQGSAEIYPRSHSKTRTERH